VSWDPEQFFRAMNATIWGSRLDSMPAGKRRGLRLARLAMVLFRDVAYGQLTLWAMSLVYTTLLSFVPLLALSFSVLKAFGVHNEVAPMLHRLLAPLGANADELSGRIIQFIDNTNVGVLGSVGLALLLYTVVSLVQKIEESFNFIWHIAEPRSITSRFSLYLSVLLVGPVLVFAAIAMTAATLNIEVVREVLALEPIGWMVYAIGRLMPYLVAIGTFTFIYMIVPNTSVRLGPALVGGIVGGLLWEIAGWGFAVFVASSTKYSAIYSGFALVILFMFWLYLSWLILLFGASVAFYRQHPESLVATGGQPRLSNRMRERLALAIMSLIGARYLTGRPAWTLQELCRTLDVPMHAVQTMLSALQHGGLLTQSNDSPRGYLPARDLGPVSVKQLLDIVRSAGEDGFLNPAGLPVSERVEQVLQQIDDSLGASLGNVSVMELAGKPATNAGLRAADPAPPSSEV
jgi:membrane protein